MDNPWNTLQSYFDTNKETKNIASGAADNILLAWPPIVSLIDKYFPTKQNVRALDYGCGTGGFCAKLRSLGFSVTGIDNALQMIDSAQTHTDSSITYLSGDADIIPTLEPFSLITSVMVFQFIDAIEQTLQRMTSSIVPGGLLVFAVFNPEWVTACLEAKTLFENFDSMQAPTRGIIRLAGKVEVPVFIRRASEYDTIIHSLGFQKILETYPPFTKEFLAVYPTVEPTNISEYMISGYKKL